MSRTPDSRHLHGARDGGGRQRQYVDGLAQVLQLLFVLHAEALLLVDDDQSQIVRVHVAREQPVRAHEHLHVAFGEAREGRLLLLGRAEAREHFHGDAEGVEAVFEGGVVLLGQNGVGQSTITCLPSWVALKAARTAISVLP
mgnify:CR=1 FL=1